jgi:hypothetical protein
MCLLIFQSLRLALCTTGFNIQKFCVLPPMHFMRFAWISEQAAIISLYRINLSVFITEAESVYCAVRTGSLTETDIFAREGSSSSIGTTTLSWVSACSTVVEHSQQEGFTECRCQRHVKHPTWRRTGDLERSNFRHKRPPASEATLANLAAVGGIMGEKWPRNFAESGDFHVTWVLLHAVKHDMGQTALLPFRRKAC